MSASITSLDCFSKYKVINTKFDSINLPSSLWKFLVSRNNHEFDTRDVMSFFDTREHVAESVISYLLKVKLCEKVKISLISYTEWIGSSVQEMDLSKLDHDLGSYTTGTIDVEDTLVTVHHELSDVFVMID